MPRRPRWADSCPPSDHDADMDDESDYADRDAEWEQEEDDGEDGEECSWDYPPSPESLKSRWQTECRAVKALERAERPGEGPSSALQAARAARDRAEEAWRKALAPKPVSIRLGYAQRKLDKAQRAVERAERDMHQFEEEARWRRQELQEAIDAATQRKAGRQKELDDLHREAGEVAEANKLRGHDEGATSAGGQKFRDDVADGLKALIEVIDEGSEARGMANLLLAKLATAPGETQHQSYNISTDGEDGEDETPFQTVTRRGRGAGSSKPRQAEHKGTTWAPGANGRWSKKSDAEHAGKGPGSPADEGKAKAAGVAGNRDGGARSAAAESCDATPTSMDTSGGGIAAPAGPRAGSMGRSTRGREDDQPQPPAKSHRGDDDQQLASVEAEGDDAARALRLKEEQDAAIAAAKAANASFGDEVSMQIAGQLYARKVDLVRQRAMAIGVEPAVDGSPLISLAPDRLNAWVKDVLAPAEAAHRQKEEDKEL